MKSFFSHTTYATDEPDLPAKDNDEKRLLNDLRLTRTELEIAYSGFDNVTEPDLIDCYIYKVNAVFPTSYGSKSAISDGKSSGA